MTEIAAITSAASGAEIPNDAAQGGVTHGQEAEQHGILGGVPGAHDKAQVLQLRYSAQDCTRVCELPGVQALLCFILW
jgi:hypothetical protein